MVSNFIDYVIPSITILDYSVENSNLAPLFQMRHMPEGFSEIPQVPTYSPIGLAMNFEYFPIVSGKETSVNEYRISNIE